MEDVEQLAVEFGRTRSLVRMREIAVALARPGATNKAGEVPEFREGLLRLGELATFDEGEDRLLALALLGRIQTQPSKVVRKQIRTLLAVRAPSISTAAASVGNPQDREYLARSLGIADFDEKGPYLASFAAGEGQTVTKARNLAVAGLLATEGSVEGSLNLLAEALHDAPMATQDMATSRARRLTRTLEAFEKALVVSNSTVTVEAGPALARLLELGLLGEWNVEREAAIELANAALSVLSAIVRPNFSCAREPAIFEPVLPVRRLFLPARWPDETLHARKVLAAVVREVIALLAPAGLSDNRLRSMLFSLLDDTTAEAWLTTMAQTVPGLSNEVRHWLVRGRALKSFAADPAAGETILEGVEKDLADACREARQLQRAWGSLHDEIVDLVLDASPVLGRGVSHASDRIDRLIRRLSSLERRRGFEFEYDVGDAVEYAPTDHEASQPMEGVKMVRITAPKVVRRSGSGIPQLILKAKVEPA